MKLFTITRVGEIGYNEYDSAVIVAETEQQVREFMAHEPAGEGSEVWLESAVVKEIVIRNIKKTTCLSASFNAG